MISSKMKFGLKQMRVTCKKILFKNEDANLLCVKRFIILVHPAQSTKLNPLITIILFVN